MDCEHERCEPQDGLGDKTCPDCGMVFICCYGCSEAGGADLPIYHAPPACRPRCDEVNAKGERCERSLIGKQPHPQDHTIWFDERTVTSSWKTTA